MSRKVLSDDELDLLAASVSQLPVDGSTEGGCDPLELGPAGRLSPEHVLSIQYAHEACARELSSALSAYFRTDCDVSVSAVRSESYGTFIESVEVPTAFYALALPPLDDLGALEIGASLALTMVDRILGGTGRGEPQVRALSDVEQDVLDAVVKRVLDGLSEAWRSVATVAFGIRGRTTRPQTLEVLPAEAGIVHIVFAVVIGDVTGSLNVCVPASVVESLSASASSAAGALDGRGWRGRGRPLTPTEREWLDYNLGRLPFMVAAGLDTRLAVGELLALQSGDVIGLGIPAHGPVDVHVGQAAKFTGHLTTHDGRAAVRVERRLRLGEATER